MLSKHTKKSNKDNIEIVRYHNEKGRFELKCYPGKHKSWKSRAENDIDKVLLSNEIFKNARKGKTASHIDLSKSFGKMPVEEIILLILHKGEILIDNPSKEAALMRLQDEIAAIIAEKCIESSTGMPVKHYDIMRSLISHNVRIETNQPAKVQALRIIHQYKTQLGIERAKMRVRLVYPIENHADMIEEIKEIHEETREEEGDLIILVGLIQPDSFKTIFDSIKSRHLKDIVKFEILSTKMPAPNNIEESKSHELLKTASRASKKTKRFKSTACNTCPNVNCENIEQQKEHIKSKWHLYNKERKLKKMHILNKDDFDILSEVEIDEFIA